MMSVVIEYKNKYFLMSKGADTSIAENSINEMTNHFSE